MMALVAAVGSYQVSTRVDVYDGAGPRVRDVEDPVMRRRSACHYGGVLSDDEGDVEEEIEDYDDEDDDDLDDDD